jgi:HK97 family phage major capsid protein
MKRIKELTDQRVKLINDARAMLDLAANEKRDLKPEEVTRYDEMLADAAKLKAQIEREQSLASIESALEVSQARHVPAEGGQVQTQGTPGERQIAAFTRYMRTGNAEAFVSEMRAASSGFSQLSDAEGGYTVPTVLQNRIYEALPADNIMRQLGTVETLGSDSTLAVAGAGVVATWIAEEGAYLIPTHNIFSQVTFAAYKAGLMLPISDELLADSAFDLESWTISHMSEKLGVLQEAAYVAGDGSSKPTGVVGGSALGKTAAGVAAITGDELIDLFFSVGGQYRRQRKTGWLMADATMGAVSKLKDGEGRYLWMPSMVAGTPDTLLGKPVNTSASMPAMTTGLKSVLFGDFSKYQIVDRSGIFIKRLVERYAEYGQVVLRISARTDGKLIDSAAVKHLIQA